MVLRILKHIGSLGTPWQKLSLSELPVIQALQIFYSEKWKMGGLIKGEKGSGASAESENPYQESAQQKSQTVILFFLYEKNNGSHETGEALQADQGHSQHHQDKTEVPGFSKYLR